MKRYTILSLLILVIFCSCEDYLEKTPNYQASAEGYFINEKAAQESRIGLYTKHSDYFLDGRYMLDATTDQLMAQYNWGSALSIARGIVTPETGGVIEEFYEEAYVMIAAANDHIANIDGMDDGLFSNMTKDEYKADARFFKAFYYFYLTETYDGVPLYKEK
ncbi:MAG: RagB/SusD family nutrient uptake outer membrane protein, partial [Halanaerobiales bacterium]|nr:RagB/SusD family nutrient uptake outer membrane protein [Halanaerobiales bacterium]